MFRPARKKVENVGGAETPYHSTDHEEYINNSVQADGESSSSNNKSNVQRRRKKTMATTVTTPSLMKTTYTQTMKSALILPYVVCILFFDGLLISSFGWKSIVFSIPVMLAGWVVVMMDGDPSGGVQLHTRIIALAFVSAIFCAQFPSYVSKALGSMAVTLFGLGTIHDRQLSGDGTPSTKTNDNMPQNQQSQKDPHVKIDDNNEDDDKHHRHHSRHPATQKRKWSGPMKTFMATLGVTCSLLTENFFIWVVSATFYPSHNPNTTPPALQDNGRIMLSWIFRNIFSLSIRDVKQLRQLFNVQWGLVAAFGATLVCCEIGLLATKSRIRQQRRRQGHLLLHKRTLWSVALRALLTLATARAIRTISFLLTVLPSQVSNCYTQHFPNPPPSNWYDWLMIGILPNSHGGCNDLIISGHATVTSTLACASTSVASNAKFSVALWTLVAIDYSIEVYEGFHYSVDMWMGALLTSLLWRIYVTLEQDNQDEEVENDGDEQEEEENFDDSNTNTPVQLRSLAEVTTQQLLWYGLPGFGAFIVVAVMPEAMANYWILLYFFCAATNTAKNGLTHYTQHLLILLLFIALAIYL